MKHWGLITAWTATAVFGVLFHFFSYLFVMSQGFAAIAFIAAKLFGTLAIILFLLSSVASIIILNPLALKLLFGTVLALPITGLAIEQFLIASEFRKLNAKYGNYSPQKTYSLPAKDLVIYKKGGKIHLGGAIEPLLVYGGMDRVIVSTRQGRSGRRLISGKFVSVSSSEVFVEYKLVSNPKSCVDNPHNAISPGYIVLANSLHPTSIKPYFFKGECISARFIPKEQVQFPRFEVRVNAPSFGHEPLQFREISYELVYIDEGSIDRLEYHRQGLKTPSSVFNKLFRPGTSNYERAITYGERISLLDFINRTFGTSIPTNVERVDIKILSKNGGKEKFLSFLGEFGTEEMEKVRSDVVLELTDDNTDKASAFQE